MTTPESKPQLPIRLTQRETEILSVVAQGYSSREVGDRLFLSPGTVSFHLSNIYVKLGVTNRVQAFRAASRMGLIPSERNLDVRELAA